ncbi:MAG: winged helix-turn-helix transcriptional regulator [Ruminococcaceae bacterium]|nr:winged helix-turn-helix transcriptional regulator [Oscillospiraceae bacterium]
MEMSNYELTRKQFKLLTFLERADKKMSQREIADVTGVSLGTVSRTLESLRNDGLVDGTIVTEKGLEALEPYRVKRAVFIAAGFGSRLVPITLNTPKPLVRVNGTRMIDTLLDAVVKAGIEEIYVVRGYLGEQFDQLLYKYPNIKFIENPIYNEANNISSALIARELLQNAYVFEADLVLYNPELITKYQYTSNYLGVPVEKTDDWCFEVKNRVITKLCIGGTDCYHMFGISYWNAEDGKKLESDIKKVFELPGGKERYWDQVSLEYCLKNYQVEVRPCTFDDIIEIDTYNDLKNIDHTYI